jgi:transcriptional regulator with XRE-family HTH domain
VNNKLPRGLFRRNLNEILKKRGITKYRLAMLSGVSTQHVSCLTNGDRWPSLDVASRLAKALECSIQDFLAVPVDLVSQSSV